MDEFDGEVRGKKLLSNTLAGFLSGESFSFYWENIQAKKEKAQDYRD